MFCLGVLRFFGFCLLLIAASTLKELWMGSAGCGWRFFGLACLDFSILWKKASQEKSEGSLLSFLLLFVSWRSARSLIVPGVFLSTSAGGVAWIVVWECALGLLG